MDYNALNKPEYKDIESVNIADNRNDLPFFITKRKELNYKLHRHEFVQIIYVVRGSTGHKINDNEFTLYKGDIFIMPPFVPHMFIPGGDAEIYEYEFIPEFINEKFSYNYKGSSFMDFAYLEPFLVAENKIKPRLNLTGTVQREVEEIFSRIMLEYNQKERDFELIIKALTLQLLIIVSRQYDKSEDNEENKHIFMKHRESLIETVDYIDENYHMPITLDDVVKVSLLSKSYFGYLFKHMTQKTFTEYLNGVRISKAVELLKTRHDLKVIDICFMCGYNNVNHFNRIFKAETGCTPTEVRKNKI